MNRENAYVGGTRLRDRHDLYTSREALGTDGTDPERWQRLAEQMNESRAQTPSVAYQDSARTIATTIPPTQLNSQHAALASIDTQLQHATQHAEALHRTYPTGVERDITNLTKRN